MYYLFKKLWMINKNSLVGKLLNILKIEPPQNNLINNTNEFVYTKIKKPKFIFLKYTRTVFIERLTRLFDVD